MAGALRKMAVYLGLAEDDAARYDEYDDYDDYPAESDGRDRDERHPRQRADEHDEPREEHHASVSRMPQRRPVPVPSPRESYRIVTLHPRTYNEARTIGEHFREATPVIMNLTDMDDSDAKRLVDFAAGLVFGLRGTIERVTQKVFLLSPVNVDVTAEDKRRIAEAGFFNQS